MALAVKHFGEQRHRGQAVRKNPLHRVLRRRAVAARHHPLVAAHGLEAGHRRLQDPALVQGGGLDEFGFFNLVAFDTAHHLGQARHAHRRVHLQLGIGGLLKHAAVGVQGLQLDHQAGLFFTPDAVAEAQIVLGVELHHIGVKAGHTLDAHLLGGIKLGDARIGRLEQVGEQANGLALFRQRGFGVGVEGDDFVVAPECGTRRAGQRLDALHLLLAVADVPNARAGHAAGRRHDKSADVGTFARGLVHAHQPVGDVALLRFAFGGAWRARARDQRSSTSLRGSASRRLRQASLADQQRSQAKRRAGHSLCADGNPGQRVAWPGRSAAQVATAR